MIFLPDAWADYQHWVSHDRPMVKRINRLVQDIMRAPHDGLGKPEPLKYHYAGVWSRRINDEHRLVYVVDGDDVTIFQARYHYQD